MNGEVKKFLLHLFATPQPVAYAVAAFDLQTMTRGACQG